MSESFVVMNSEVHSDITRIANFWQEFLFRQQDSNSQDIRVDSFNISENQDYQEGINYFLKFITEFLVTLEEWLVEDVIPFLFDILIEILLNIYKNFEKDPPFSFKQIYDFLSIFGLKKIRSKTWNRISIAMQWKKISTQWIDRNFCENYLANTLFREGDFDSKPLVDLIRTIIIMEKEENKRKKFNEDLTAYLSDL